MADWVKGAEAMFKKLEKLAEEFPDKVANAMYMEAQLIMTESKKICPVYPTRAQLKAMGLSFRKGEVPGTLRASGTVHPPVRKGKDITVTLSYGGAASAYAVPQHERLDFHHVNGEAKYLEKPLNAAREGLAERIGKRINLNNPE